MHCAHGAFDIPYGLSTHVVPLFLGLVSKSFDHHNLVGHRTTTNPIVYMDWTAPSWMDPSLHHPCIEGGPCQSVPVYMGQQARTQSLFLWCCASTSEKVENDKILGFFLKSNTHTPTKLMQSGLYQNSCRPLASLDWTSKKKDVFPLRPSKGPM